MSRRCSYHGGEATDLVVRAATPDDLTAIRSLVFSILRENGFREDPEGADADLFDPAAYSRSDSLLEVLEAGGEIVGVIAGHPAADGDWELRRLYLAPDLRRGGHGRRLLERAIAFAVTTGARRIRLETSRRLEAAVTLYRARGFREASASFASARTADCDLLLTLDLDPDP